MDKSFKHSGDLGDIIYSLPTIKRLGGGTLYLDITGGNDEPICKMQCMEGKTKFNEKSYNYIKPLLEVQDYIKEVKIYNGEKIDYNLNKFRYKFADPNSRSRTKNLLDLHLEAFNLPVWDSNEGWLKVDKKINLNKKTLVTRTPRYQSNFPWFQSNKFNIRDNAMFIGLPKEHEYFEWTFDIKVPYYPVKNALEMAIALNSCKALITNQTSTLAIAIGLGTVPIVQEVDQRVPNCVFSDKKNMNYV